MPKFRPAVVLGTTIALAASSAVATTAGAHTAPASSQNVVLYAQLEELDSYQPATGAHGVFYPASDYLNGQLCRVPATYTAADGTTQPSTYAGDFVEGSDVPAPDGSTPNGWSILSPVAGTSAASTFFHFVGQGDSFGCAFDTRGDFIGTDEGGGNPIGPDGTIAMFFAPNYSSSDACILASGLPQPGQLAMNSNGDVLVPLAGAPTAGGGRVARIAAADLPTSPADCHTVNLQTFISDPTMHTPLAIIRDPSNLDSESWIVASVLGPQEINEYDAHGSYVRTVLPPGLAHYPVSLAYDDGYLYYVDIGLGLNPNPTSPIDTQDGQGAVYRFKLSDPVPNVETVAGGLTYPDGVAVYPSSDVTLP